MSLAILATVTTVTTYLCRRNGDGMEQIVKNSINANCLLFPNPVIVCCTYDAQGRANAATLAWGGIAASEPAQVSIAVRPSRHTYEALQRTKAFTINLPSVEHATQSDFFGIVSGRDVDKFGVTGLTAIRGTYVDAPFIEEFPYNMECKVLHALELGTHTLFIGEVLDVKVDSSLIDADGKTSWETARLLTFDSMARTYRAPGEVVGQAFNIGKKWLAR